MPPLKWPVVVLWDPPGEGACKGASLTSCQLTNGSIENHSSSNLSELSEDADKENRPPILKPETCSLLRFKVNMYGKIGELVVDSGAAQDFVNERTADSLNLPVWDAGNNPVEYADGRVGLANRVVPVLKYRIGQFVDVRPFTAIKTNIADIILGKPWLKAFNPLIDWVSNTMTLVRGDAVYIIKAADKRHAHPCGNCFPS